MKKKNILHNTIEAYACSCNDACSGCSSAVAACSYYECSCNSDIGIAIADLAFDSSESGSNYSEIQEASTPAEWTRDDGSGSEK